MPVAPRGREILALAASALLLAASAARASCPGLGSGSTYAAGASPQMVVSADFDGDGVADLAVASLTGPSLEILRGLGGTGAFAAPVGYTAGTAGAALAVSDFNGDGVPDIAVAVSNGVAIWLGDGHGAFTGGRVFPMGSALRGIVCADFDGDGIVDLAVSSNATNAVLVARGGGSNGVGDGTFGAPVAYAVGSAPARLIAADLDGDGVLDLAVANNGGASVTILKGHAVNGLGDGTFTTLATLPVAGSPWGIAALDWNHDGVLDLVVSNGAGSNLALLRGTGVPGQAGSGAFVAAPSVTTPATPRDLVVGDFDGDGIADLAVACASPGVVAVLRGTGLTFATLGSFATGPGAQGIAAGDWNGDGAPDVVTANAGGSSVTRFLGACPHAPGAAVTLLSPAGGEDWWPGLPQTVRWTRAGGVVAVDADLSRDGGATWVPLARGAVADSIVVPAVGAPNAHLRARVRDALVPARADASRADFTLCGLLGTAIVSDAGLSPTALACADLDGDGALDLVAADAASVVALRGDGTGRFTAGPAFAAAGTQRLRLVDADGDGVPDLARLSPAGLTLRRGDRGSGFGPESLIVATPAADFACGDFDGDGALDWALLSTDAAGSRLTVRPGGGVGASWTATLAGAPVALECRDVDGDGLLDLVAATATQVQVWLGNGVAARGDGTFRPGPARSLAATPGDIAVGDLNADGTPDVLACSPLTGDLWTLAVTAPNPSAPAGAIAWPVATAAGAQPRRPVLVDLDGDGRLDVAVALAGEGALAVLPGAASGLGAPVRYAAGACGPALVVGDFNGDGSPDVVVAGTDGRVRCLPAPCSPRIARAIAIASPADTSAATVGFEKRWSWTRTASVAEVRAELSRDGGAHWVTLADAAGLPGPAGSGTFTWSPSGPPTPSARLRFSDSRCASSFDETRSFAIVAPFDSTRTSAALPAAAAFACADLDGDGRPDAVVTDGTLLQVLHGEGGGTFREIARFAEPGTRRIALADLDGDGALDLVTLGASAVTIRRGAGDGTFGPRQLLAVEDQCADLALADLDGDAIPELVVTGGSGRVTVRRGLGRDSTGAIAFAPPTFTGLSFQPTALAVADLNGDGAADLILAHTGGLATLLGGVSGGRATCTFHLASNRAFGAGDVRALRVADLDGDGRLDVAAADSAAHAVLVAAGDGAGGFAAPVAIALPDAPTAVALADLDHDGGADLAAALAGGGLALVRGDPAQPLGQRFAPAGRLAAGGGTRALALLDADGDGVPDALVLDPAGALRVLRGGTHAPGAPEITSPAAGANVQPGDVLDVSWTSPPGVAAVDVQLSRDAGRTWSTLAAELTGTHWRWLVALPGGAARLRVRDAAAPGAVRTSGVSISIGALPADAPPSRPGAARLGAPWPNPASGPVACALTLGAPGHVHVELCDVLGRRVRTLLDADLAAGEQALVWDGADERGAPVAPGLYFLRARAPGLAAARRIAVTR